MELEFIATFVQLVTTHHSSLYLACYFLNYDTFIYHINNAEASKVITFIIDRLLASYAKTYNIANLKTLNITRI